MIDLKFSYNWNHKLDCHAFTTIRIFQPAKHIAGEKVRLLLKDQEIGNATIKSINTFFINQLNPFMSYVDTGYSPQECEAIIRKMYPKIDLGITRLAMLLIVKDEIKKPQQPQLFNQTTN